MADLASSLVYPFVPDASWSRCVWVPTTITRSDGVVEEWRDVYCYPNGSEVAFPQGSERADQPFGSLASSWAGRVAGSGAGAGSASSGAPLPAPVARTLFPGFGRLTDLQRKWLIVAIVVAIVAVAGYAVAKSPPADVARRVVRVTRAVRS